jgi:aminopeptidase N
MSRVIRLYEQFEPESYNLSLNPDKHRMTFSGHIEIEGYKRGRPTKRIVLHVKNLKIKSVNLIQLDKTQPKTLKLIRIVNHVRYDELRLHCLDSLRPGTKYRIEIEYNGRITRQMNGLYPCFYTENGQQEIILATQLESHHAREVFPCIDEPEAKAIFNLTLISKGSDIVLANTDIKKITKHVDKTINEFEPTPKMSPYLLAFVIGKVKQLEKTSKNGIKVRTFSRPSLINYTKFALETAVKCLDLYIDYFDIEYPLSKCDLIALPDFASGAMENWGLITFREQGLIVDPNNTSLVMKQYVASVIAHELSHQWFGNLVTMRWWNDLWLNESFATLLSYLALDSLFPAWKIWTQFIVEEQVPAFRLDELENTHPINVTINHPDEIRTIFDNISYDKGASVLLMLMRYLGESDFKNGLKRYLKKHAYSNTESDDLWNAWEEVSSKDVTRFMRSWINQAGYPLVKTVISGKQVTLSQQRFIVNPKAKLDSNTWPLPLFASANTKLPELMTKSSLMSQSNNHNQPLIVNLNRSGFYRVIYNREHLQLLARSVTSLKLNELDRMGLLSDHFEAAKAGLLSTKEVLELLNAYLNEDSVVVWEMISSVIAGLRSIIDSEDLLKTMNPSIHQLIARQYKRLGWKDSSKFNHFDKLLQPLILSIACMSDYKPALDEAKNLFLARKRKPIRPDIRSVVYLTIARYGGIKEFTELLNMHNQSDSSEERLILSGALTGFKQPDIIQKSLALITSKDVRLQDVAYWLSYSFSNRYSKIQAWEWLKTNWKWLKENLGNDLSFYTVPLYVSRAFSDMDFLKEYREFFDAHSEPSLNRPIKQGIENITWKALWKQRDIKTIAEFYKSVPNQA